MLNTTRVDSKYVVVERDGVFFQSRVTEGYSVGRRL